MRSSARVSSKKKLVKNPASKTEILEQNERPLDTKVANSGTTKGKKLAKKSDLSTKSSDQDSRALEDVVVHNDLWLLRYNINEKGIGKILLPPSLSILLQSDRVSISPSAGGLFIRSI